MLLVITIHPENGFIDLNSAEVEMTGRAHGLLRPLLHECSSRIMTSLASKTALSDLAAMVEQRADHAALRAIGFTKIAIVIELDQAEVSAAVQLLRNQDGARAVEPA